jgi:hypothetical protein
MGPAAASEISVPLAFAAISAPLQHPVATVERALLVLLRSEGATPRLFSDLVSCLEQLKGRREADRAKLKILDLMHGFAHLDEPASERLARLILFEASEAVKTGIVKLLGIHGARASAVTLCSLMVDENASAAMKVACIDSALRLSHSLPELRPVLRLLAQDADASVRTAATMALASTNPHPIEAKLHTLRLPHEEKGPIYDLIQCYARLGLDKEASFADALSSIPTGREDPQQVSKAVEKAWQIIEPLAPQVLGVALALLRSETFKDAMASGRLQLGLGGVEVLSLTPGRAAKVGRALLQILPARVLHIEAPTWRSQGAPFQNVFDSFVASRPFEEVSTLDFSTLRAPVFVPLGQLQVPAAYPAPRSLILPDVTATGRGDAIDNVMTHSRLEELVRASADGTVKAFIRREREFGQFHGFFLSVSGAKGRPLFTDPS